MSKECFEIQFKLKPNRLKLTKHCYLHELMLEVNLSFLNGCSGENQFLWQANQFIV